MWPRTNALTIRFVHGEACYDTWVLDPRRFTGQANTELCALKAIEDYQNEFRFHFPNEQDFDVKGEDGRPGALCSPLVPVFA